MNISNIALVRATDVIPFDGVINSLSNTPNLKKINDNEFRHEMFDLLRRNDKFKENKEENDKILDKYIPYTSMYNSMVLCSLNGVVPDDKGFKNNEFSYKSCAIIDGLEEQINKSKFASFAPTDTAIVGNLELSDNAIILIESGRYNELSEEDKQKINSLGINIKIFEGDLRENVNKTLSETGRYVPQELSLNKEDKGYIKSDTSNELLEVIDSVAKEYNVSKITHDNILKGFYDYEDGEKIKDVKDEYSKMLKVTDCYQKSFFKYLFSNMDIDENLQAEVFYCMNSDVYMEKLCERIEEIGLDKYEKVVGKYNSLLEKLKEEGKLPTPQEVVDNLDKNIDFDLTELISEVEKDDKDKKMSNSKNEELTLGEELKKMTNSQEDVVKLASKEGEDNFISEISTDSINEKDLI